MKLTHATAVPWSLGLTGDFLCWLQHRAEAAPMPGQGCASEIQDPGSG